MARVSINKLRSEIPEGTLSGKIIRAKRVNLKYLMVVHEDDHYIVCAYERCLGGTLISRLPWIEDFETAVIRYKEAEINLKTKECL